MAQLWNNLDGLPIKYGALEATAGTAGEYVTNGPRRYVEVILADLTTLTTTAAVVDYNVWIPKNARIEQVDVVTVTAATSGGSATLTIGLMKKDALSQAGYATLYSATGLISALAITAFDAAGETNVITVGSTGAGASIGTTLTEKVLISAKYTTAVFTAGKLAIRVYYSF